MLVTNLKKTSASLKANPPSKPRTEISRKGAKVIHQILKGFSSSLHYPRASGAVSMYMVTHWSGSDQRTECNFLGVSNSLMAKLGRGICDGLWGVLCQPRPSAPHCEGRRPPYPLTLSI